MRVGRFFRRALHGLQCQIRRYQRGNSPLGVLRGSRSGGLRRSEETGVADRRIGLVFLYGTAGLGREGPRVCVKVD